MYVATARVRVHVPAARSLKDRRMVVRKVVDRVRARTGAAIADVGPQDRWQVAAFGLAAVSGDRAKADEVIDGALAVIEGAILGDAVVTSRERELKHYEDAQWFGDIDVPAQKPVDWNDQDDDDPGDAR